MTITATRLRQVDAAEDFLWQELGLRQLRVRHHDAVARLEVEPEDMTQFMEENPPACSDCDERIGIHVCRYVEASVRGRASQAIRSPLDNLNWRERLSKAQKSEGRESSSHDRSDTKYFVYFQVK